MFTVYALNNALSRIPGMALRTLTTDAAGPAAQQRLEPAQLEGLYRNQDIRMHRRIAGASVSLGMLGELPSLVRWADVVHLTAIYSFPTLPTLLLCRLFGKPVVWSPHGAVQDAFEWEGTKRKSMKRIWEMACNALLLSRSARLHVISERERTSTQARLPRAGAFIVPNGVEIPDELPQREWLPRGVLRLMYLGRLSQKKGIENLLHAIARHDDPSLSLSIYGGGEADYVTCLHDLAGKLGILNRRVFFAGHVDGADKSRAFLQSDVCIVPSHTECFCMVVAESLAHGVPVIASHGTPWAEVETEGCGLWVDNAPESLLAAIERIRGMDLAEMGQRGRSWMKRDFTWEVAAARMADIYRKLVA
ncbi:MAG TPA: glycosyltransferase [Gallionella sp.]|nr:glycosyltransferase [Gallionella sp.]